MGETRDRTFRQHRPEHTVLHGLVRDHLAGFLARAEQHYRAGIPRYAQRELHEYLKCGIHAHGFARATCRDCGHELLVAFSCKKRGVCPSCNSRRMSDTAARLVDRVLPDVRLRQWVLSVPFELRIVLAKDPEALSACGRILVEEVFRWQRGRALLRGYQAEVAAGDVRGAAVCFPQRFGGSLNLNVHYHVLVPDAFFYRAKDGSIQHELLPRPSGLELEELTHNVALRCLRWLRRRGLIVDAPPAVAEPHRAPTALDACLSGSVGLGDLVRIRHSGKPEPARRRSATSAEKRVGGGVFNVHAGTVASNKDDRERLARYCARPPLSLERLSLTPDGRVAYQLRAPIRGATHRLLEPADFLARLCALIPPPRHPLIRFHGVLAPKSSWRKEVIPKPAPNDAPPRAPAPSPRQLLAAPAPDVPGDDSTRGRLWDSTRLDWATLLRRVYDVDALACPCGGRLRSVELLTSPEDARPVLERLGLPADPPRLRATPPSADRDAAHDCPEEHWDQTAPDPTDDLPDLEAPDPVPDDW